MNFELCHTCKYEHSRICCSGCEQDNDEYVKAEWFMKKEAEIRADEKQKMINETLKIISKELTLLEERLRIETYEGRWIGEEKCLFAIERLEHLAEKTKGETE